MAQFGVGAHPRSANLLAPLAVLAIAAVGGGLLLGVLGRLVPGARRAIRARIARRRQAAAAATAELRARVLMDELCPHGWRARVTMFGSPRDLPADAPGQRFRVALDWSELGPDGSRPVLARRVWATSIIGALDAMVADRRTDETLQQIEQGALADGAVWPDPPDPPAR